VQASSPWTGIEYAIASMMLDFGLVAEGSRVVRNIHERYRRAGRFWRHIECGEHYYRAMSSWAVLLAATGFKIDVPRGELTVAPVVGGGTFRAPWVASSGWGRIDRTARRFALSCESGKLRFRRLRLRFAASGASGRRAGVTITRRGDWTTLEFRRAVALGEGDTLVIE
jgi:hypothetical protein